MEPLSGVNYERNEKSFFCDQVIILHVIFDIKMFLIGCYDSEID